MAIDFLIFGLLLISFIINLLALGAFWVTPALRTTANRFTINLLIINLIGCLILGPTLFLTNESGEPVTTYTQTTDDSIEYISKPGNHQLTIKHNGNLVEEEGIILRKNATIETLFKRNSTYYQELIIDKSQDAIVITEIEEERPESAEENVSSLPAPKLDVRNFRCWSIDMAAALSTLAVLLVVGDTWCAVTDPLRYHSRISAVKAWILIALTWGLGIFFGVLSAFRALEFESDSIITKQKRFATTFTETHFSQSSSAAIFGIVFACLYFIVIILLPFGFICGMYWRIFNEARENGLRMRQNGSSPLLQSALNLTQHYQQSASHLPLQYSNSLCVHRSSVSSTSSAGGGVCSHNNGGLQLQIDQTRRSSPGCLRRDSANKVLLPTISDDGMSDDVPADNAVPESNEQHLLGNQHILLTLQSASGEIKRNYSVRQLPLLGTSSQDFRETNRLQGIRQVHSSPNLRKYTLPNKEEGGSTGLDEQNRNRLHTLPHQQSHHALQIPAIHHHSPKALSYMSTLRHRLSNASSLFKYREESRAARISILVVVMFLVSYLPYGFLVLLQSHVPAANFPHSTQLAIFMIILSNLSSPFIFAYRNKRVRRGVKRIFGCDARHQRALERQSVSSGRGSGLLQRHNSTFKRSGMKPSNYSPSNSCKYLTPQSSHESPAHTTLTLRPNSSCGTIVNFSLANRSDSMRSNGQPKALVRAAAGHFCPRPMLQRGITIVEQVPLGSKLAAKRSLFKMFLQSSNCAGQQAVPTEV